MHRQQHTLLSWNIARNSKQIHIGFGPWSVTWKVQYNFKWCQNLTKKLMKNGRRGEKHWILELAKLGDNMENSMRHYIRSMVGLQACHSGIDVLYGPHVFRYLGTNPLWRKHSLKLAIKWPFLGSILVKQVFRFLSPMRIGNTKERLQASVLASEKTRVWVLDSSVPQSLLRQLTELVLIGA